MRQQGSTHASWRWSMGMPKESENLWSEKFYLRMALKLRPRQPT